MSQTPNLDRVVEMSALTDALSKAFPDMTPDQYPWRTSHKGDAGSVRGSWPVPRKARTSASAAQQALDRIRQAALPAARSQSVSPGFGSLSKQQQVVLPMLLPMLLPQLACCVNQNRMPLTTEYVFCAICMSWHHILHITSEPHALATVCTLIHSGHVFTADCVCDAR